MSTTYRYNINGQTVYPIHSDELSKELSLESGQRFFRAKLNGAISFVRQDFDYLHAQPFDTDFIFTIERYLNNAWIEEYKAKFNKTDCKWDEDNRKVDVSLTTYDNYLPVLEGLDKEYNLIELSPEVNSLIIHKRALIQLYVPGDSVLSCFIGGTYWEQDCSVIETENELLNLYFKKASQLIVFELFGTATPTDIVSAYAGKTSGQYLGNGPYRMTYSVLPEYDEYENPTGNTIYKYAILRLSDGQAMFESVGYGLPLRNEVEMLPVAGSGATGTLTVYGRLIDVWMRYLVDVPKIDNNATYPVPLNDITDNNRNYKYCIGYNTDLALTNTKYSTTPTKYGRNDYGTYFLPPYSIYGQKFYPISRSNWGNASLWFGFHIFDYLLEQKARKAYKLKNAYPIASVIKVLLNKVAPAITHEATTEYSEFLYGSTNPVSLLPINLFITPKSNITAGDYDKAAQRGPITLNDIFSMLKSVYQCYWYIDGNKLKIEHISWFKNGGSYSGNQTIGTDLTTMLYRKNGKKWGFGTNNWEFEKDIMPERLQFKWMDDVSEAFEGYPIEVDNKYVAKGNIENIQLSKFTTDIDFMLLNPGNVSPDGFALLSGVNKNLYDSLSPDVAMGYYLFGQYLTIDPAFNTTGYMPVIAGEIYTGQKLVCLNWYTEAKAYISSESSFSVGATYKAPANAAYARVSAYASDWSSFTFHSLALTLPFVNHNVDGADLLLQNGYLSWLTLHPEYYMHDLPAKTVKINNEVVQAIGIKKSKKHTVEFPSSEMPNLFHLIKTHLGNGQVDKISTNLSSRMNKITLKYDTE